MSARSVPGKSTFETTQPWVLYHYGLTHDLWWPFWNSTRFLGRARMVLECIVCGERRRVSFKIPRFGPIPDRGHHPIRSAFLAEHAHPDRWRIPRPIPAASTWTPWRCAWRPTSTTGRRAVAERSVHEAAVEAMAAALVGPDRNQWRGAYGSIPPDPDAWHYETDGTCSYDTKKAARIALAALVASAEVREGIEDEVWLSTYSAPKPGPEPSSDRYWLNVTVDAILTALAGTDRPSTKGTP